MMKKGIAVLLATGIALQPVMVFAGNESFQFRGIDWGLKMTDLISAVVRHEHDLDKDFDTDDYSTKIDRFIVYDRSVGGHSCTAIYFVVDDKFAEGAYALTEEHSNVEQYYLDYKDLIEKYTEKYGEPDDNSLEWLADSIYKDKPDKYGRAVALGELACSAEWDAEDGSAIMFTMTGDNYEVSTRIDYLCPGFFDLEDLSAEDDGI